jgi:hypothetical protein
LPGFNERGKLEASGMSNRPPNLNRLHARLLFNLAHYFIVELWGIKTDVGGDQKELCLPIIRSDDSVEQMIVDPIRLPRGMSREPLGIGWGDIDLDDRGSKSRSQRDPRSSHNGKQ